MKYMLIAKEDWVAILEKLDDLRLCVSDVVGVVDFLNYANHQSAAKDLEEAIAEIDLGIDEVVSLVENSVREKVER